MGRKQLPQHINSILEEAWETFKVSSDNIIRDIFVKTNILSLSTNYFDNNTLGFVAFVQVSYEANFKYTNEISHCTSGPIKLK